MKHKMFSWLGVVLVTITIVPIGLAILSDGDWFFAVLIFAVLIPAEFLGIHPDIAFVVVPTIALIASYGMGWGLERAWRYICKPTPLAPNNSNHDAVQ